MLYRLARFILTTVILTSAQTTPVHGESARGETSTSSNNSGFQMSFGPFDTTLARRATTFITEQGFVTTERSLASVFYISNNQLFSKGFFISADPSDAYIPFAINTTAKSISTTWLPAKFPVWYNDAFAGNHEATYCKGSDDRIYIVLQSPPSVCTPVSASTLPLASATRTSIGSTRSSISTTNPLRNSATSSSVTTIAHNVTTSPDSITSFPSNTTTFSGSTVIFSSDTITSSNFIAPSSNGSIDQVAEATSVIENSSYQSFCSDYLGYTKTLATSTVTANATIDATITQSTGVFTTLVKTTVPVTKTVPTTTEIDTTTPVQTTTTTTTIVEALTFTANNRKREAALPQVCAECDNRKVRRGAPTVSSLRIPSLLTPYAPNILSSACSLEASSVTTTSTTTTTAIYNQTALFTNNVPSSTATIVSNSNDTTTVSDGISTIITTAPTSTSTVTVTTTSTTTITIASGAPSGTLTYLSIDPDPNTSPAFALSDPATHMTDNAYNTTLREVFIVTSAGQLYSVTNQAYYYPDTASANKLCWSTTASQSSTQFSIQRNTTNNENQLFLKQSADGPAYDFCIATKASGDGNGATGLHVHFYPDSLSFPTSCVATNLFLVPTT